MSKTKESDSIDHLLEKWDRAKAEKSNWEEKADKYKERIERMMNSQDVDRLKTDRYVVVMRSNTRQTVSKANLPKEIWDRYSTRVSYNSLHLTKR